MSTGLPSARIPVRTSTFQKIIRMVVETACVPPERTCAPAYLSVEKDACASASRQVVWGDKIRKSVIVPCSPLRNLLIYVCKEQRLLKKSLHFAYNLRMVLRLHGTFCRLTAWVDTGICNERFLNVCYIRACDAETVSWKKPTHSLQVNNSIERAAACL